MYLSMSNVHIRILFIIFVYYYSYGCLFHYCYIFLYYIVETCIVEIYSVNCCTYYAANLVKLHVFFFFKYCLFVFTYFYLGFTKLVIIKKTERCYISHIYFSIIIVFYTYNTRVSKNNNAILVNLIQNTSIKSLIYRI